MAPTPRAKILLTTTMDWPFAARLAAGFAAASLDVEAIAPRSHVLSKSRFVSRRYAYQPLRAEASLAHAIATARPALIVPCDDRALMQLLALWRRSEARREDGVASLIACSLGNPALYRRILARSEFIAAARSDGIAAATMLPVADAQALEHAVAALGLPAVLKADGTWGGDGVAVVHDRESAREAWRRMTRAPSRARSLFRAVDRGDLHHVSAALHAPRPAVGLQAFVDGTPATSSFACWKGEVLAALHFDVVATAGARKPASVLRRVSDTAMDEAAKKIAHRYGLSGLHGLDFMRDARGRAQLIEMNPRATPTAHLALGEGRDLPVALASALLAAPVPARKAATESGTIALFPQEWARAPSSPHLATAYHDVPWDDPAVLAALVGEGPARALAQGRQSLPDFLLQAAHPPLEGGSKHP